RRKLAGCGAGRSCRRAGPPPRRGKWPCSTRRAPWSPSRPWIRCGACCGPARCCRLVLESTGDEQGQGRNARGEKGESHLAAGRKKTLGAPLPRTERHTNLRQVWFVHYFWGERKE